MTDGVVLRQLKHPKPVWRVVWSPDGNHLASSCDDGSLRVWDVATWSLTQRIEAHTGHIGCVDWSPDGKRLFSVSDRRVAQIWDVASGERVGVPLKHEYQAVRGGTWSPDGRFVATATSQSDTIYLWDTTDTEATPRKLEGHFSPNWLAWSSTGDRLASSGEKGAVMIWDVDSGQRIQNLEGHVGEALRLSWSPDDRFVASAGRDGSVRVWDVDKGELALLLRSRENAAICTAWDPTGKWLLAGCSNGLIRIWDMEASRNSFEAHASSVYVLDWTPGGMLRTMGKEALKTWDLERTKINKEFHCPPGLLDARHFSPDGTLFVARGDGTTDYIWSTELAQQHNVGSFAPGEVGLSTGAVLALGTLNRRAVRWGLDSSTVTIVEDGKRTILDSRKMEVLQEDDAVFDLDSHCFISEDNRWIVGTRDNEVHILDVVSLQRKARLAVTRDEFQKIASIKFSTAGHRIAGVLDREVLLWDVTSGQLSGTLSGHALSVHYANYWYEQILAWSPNGERIATAGADGTIRIWDTNDCQSVLTLTVGKAVSAVLWHPDGERLVAGTVDGQIQIWDARRGYEVSGD